MRQGGRRKNDWKGKVLVVLVFGVPSDSGMTRIEFERKREEIRQSRTVPLCSRKSIKGGRAFASHASAESEQGVAEDRGRKSVGMG